MRISGDVDLLTAPELAGATFMSCRGIAVLVAAIQLAALRGQVVRMVQPSPRARQVFTLGGVGRLLEPA